MNGLDLFSGIGGLSFTLNLLITSMESVLTTKISIVLVGDIKPAKYNPRTISDAALSGLVESIRKFGMPQPLVVNKRSGVLVSGHQRLRAAEMIGMKEVPVVYVDLEPAQEKALNVTLNNRSIGGEFNDVLNVILDDIERDLGSDFMASLRLDDIRIPDVSFNEATGAKELKEDEFKEFSHSCPRCKFEFNS